MSIRGHWLFRKAYWNKLKWAWRNPKCVLFGHVWAGPVQLYQGLPYTDGCSRCGNRRIAE